MYNDSFDKLLLRWEIERLIDEIDSIYVSDRDKEIFKLRLFHDITYAKLGKMYNVSKTRIGQICNKLYRYLKRPHREQVLKEFKDGLV